ncbi:MULTISPECIES: hybrid sensor histidine kinase/response regulator [Pseudoalteromonas]|uniref:histidine kinase n=1 Tax=Pseudoalteromonas luteoviolacea (strain 2ta16) TaxID=1353533 RepID=V4HRZ3_PSEL2|nr:MULTISPECIES: hybrid sensor histidine kinase/response regulator [Pseudoalteromonas]ESP90694.1 bacteriophytochrome (light-regulated signal transduction histidine kinase) [Pseudoalteromonas luteoviolacea 2ta16]KZN41731.1 hypothetical protein N483_13760 [Pseudoalteromonas luteoviolacea NCIMB 1944]MCG7548109.1 response regulator [Pseudoalteromonas sp. Of7M-16]
MDVLNVLIVDDSEDDRYFLKRTLTSDGSHWHVLEAESGEHGLDILKSHQVDIVLLDYSLPGTDGLMTLSAINKQFPLLPVIMLTGQGSETVAAESIKNGASDYISKGGLTHLSLMKSINSAIHSARLHRRIEEKNRELSQFAYVLAHDLKQPANAVRKMSQVIVQNYHQCVPANVLDKLTLINQSSLQMYGLIDALVCYTQLDLDDSHLFEKTDFNKCVEIAISNLTTQIESSSAKIAWSDLPSITAIPSFVVQLFQNILENSLKYSESQPFIDISCQCDETCWHFTVQDNGIGIPPQLRHKVFEPLARLHNSETYAGSGLGLATAKRIVNKHRGDIYFSDNECGQGSKLHFSVSKKLMVSEKVNALE